MGQTLQALLFVLVAAGAGFLFWQELSRRLAAVRRAAGPWPVDGAERRWLRTLREVLLQSKILRHRPLPGLAHALVFWAFLAFALETLNHFSQAFWAPGVLPRAGLFHDLFQGLVALFAWAAAGGIVYLAFRRFVLRPAPLGRKLSWESGLVALFILTLMLTYLAKHHGCVEPGTAAAQANWWLHTLTLLAFLVLIPRPKHLHLVLGPFAVWFRNETPGELAPLDFEREETGVQALAQLGKPVALAAFACVECGRCLEHCPAASTGKALDPKQLVLDLRAGFLDDPDKPAVESGQIQAEWLWQCTTCGACAEQCPTGNDQPLTILELRRGLTSEGEFPDTLRTLFDNLERSGNPWRYGAQDATAFIEGAGIPWHSGHKVLYWMGCMARYDEAYRKVALDFVKVLRAAGVDFGVLRKEKCTGDAARRAGNEMAFQELAMENAAAINEAAPELIVTTCPHCLRTLEEYKTLAADVRLADVPIVHHSAYIRRLVDEGRRRLDPARAGAAQAVYHDACYLSRYGGDELVDAPREALRAGGLRLREAELHGRRSFCCGAGGAQLFMEETAGTRVNHARTDQLLATGAETVCTSCPFCRTMVADGVRDKGRDEVRVLDVAPVVAAALPDAG